MNILSNNIIYIYFFACVVILTYSNFTKTQRIVLIYFSTIAMRLFVPVKLSITIVMLLLMMFVIEEYLSPDKEKIQMVRKWNLKALDYVYMMLFQDAICMMGLTLFFTWDWWLAISKNSNGHTWPYYLVVLVCLLITMHRLCTPRLVIKEYGKIKKYFYNYVEKNIGLGNQDLITKLEMLSEIEDHSYFIREHSYNWISIEFLKYKIGKNESTKSKEQHQFLKTWRQYLDKLRDYGFIKSLKKFRSKMHTLFSQVGYWIKAGSRKIRGYSTLEMQLIRIIAIEEGYDYKARRKIFEIFYSSVFYPAFYDYLKRNKVNKQYHYKEYILYVYLKNIHIRVGGEIFSSIAQLLENANGGNKKLRVEDYNMSQLYVAYLGLPFAAKYTVKKLLIHPEIVISYELDLNYANFFLQLITDHEITSEKTMAVEDVKKRYEQYKNDLTPERKLYVIGNATLPLVENNILYAGPSWPTYGENACWSFAFEIYYRIWGLGFDSYRGSEDDLLKNVSCGIARSINAENAQNFLGAAVPGAVIRLADNIEGHDHEEGKHHSQILLETDEKGVVIYQSTDVATSIHFFTWKEYADQYEDYKYFKYIKWPEARHL